MTQIREISSRDNQYLKPARGLKSKKERQANQAFLLEGLRLCEEALQAAWPLRFALVAESVLTADQPRWRLLLADLQLAGCPVYSLPDRLLKDVSDTAHCQGLVLVAELPAPVRELPREADFVVLADRLADPGNLGSLMRTACAVGVAALVLTPECADAFSPKVVRASMGAVLRLPLLVASSDAQALAWLEARALTLLAAAQSDCRYDQIDLTQPLAWLMGSEAAGLSAFWRAQAAQSVSLPMAAGVESLNVAAAAAVLLYQTAQQRGFAAACR